MKISDKNNYSKSLVYKTKQTKMALLNATKLDIKFFYIPAKVYIDR